MTEYCEICYEEFEKDGKDENGKPLFVKLNECSHLFCLECFKETFASMITEQQRHDDLRCPMFKCEARPTLDEIEMIVAPEVFVKYKKFCDNSRVAMDKVNLMFCPKIGCEQVVDKRVNKVDNHLQCPKCSVKICIKCKKEKHWGACKKKKKSKALQEWVGGKSDVEVSNCPNCKALIEKQGGCAHMTCVVCKQTHCWMCGFNTRGAHSIFFESLCQTWNSFSGSSNIAQQTQCWKIIRLPLFALMILIGPSIVACLAAIAGTIALALGTVAMAFALVIGFLGSPCFLKSAVDGRGWRNNICKKPLREILIIIGGPFAYVAFIVAGTCAFAFGSVLGTLMLVAASFVFVGYHFVAIAFILRMTYKQYFTCRKVVHGLDESDDSDKQSNKDSQDGVIQEKIVAVDDDIENQAIKINENSNNKVIPKNQQESSAIEMQQNLINDQIDSAPQFFDVKLGAHYNKAASERQAQTNDIMGSQKIRDRAQTYIEKPEHRLRANSSKHAIRAQKAHYAESYKKHVVMLRSIMHQQRQCQAEQDKKKSIFFTKPVVADVKAVEFNNNQD